MTKEQILKLAKLSGLNSFTGEKDDGTDSEYWEGWEDQLLKFALAIHEEGYNKGYNKGYGERYEMGSSTRREGKSDEHLS